MEYKNELYENPYKIHWSFSSGGKQRPYDMVAYHADQTYNIYK